MSRWLRTDPGVTPQDIGDILPLNESSDLAGIDAAGVVVRGHYETFYVWRKYYKYAWDDYNRG